jgi:hypothetical protein
MTRGAKPYLVPDPSSITLGPWQLLDDAEWVPLEGQIEGWDTGTDLRIRREIQVDAGRLRAETGIGPTAQLVATASWTSSTTTMRGLAGTVRVGSAGSVFLDGTLPGDRVAGVLDIRTTVSLAAGEEGPPGVAGAAGSVFHEDRHRLALEGSGSLFPVAVVDFARTPYDVDASWHLQTSVELDAPFLGRFLLSLNEKDTELVAAVSARSRTPRQEALVEELHHGVAQLMLRLAEDVNADEPLSERDWVPDTIGDVLARTLASGDQPVPHVSQDPSEASNRRSRLEGSTRRSGHGRSFR